MITLQKQALQTKTHTMSDVLFYTAIILTIPLSLIIGAKLKANTGITIIEYLYVFFATFCYLLLIKPTYDSVTKIITFNNGKNYEATVRAEPATRLVKTGRYTSSYVYQTDHYFTFTEVNDSIKKTCFLENSHYNIEGNRASIIYSKSQNKLYLASDNDLFINYVIMLFIPASLLINILLSLGLFNTKVQKTRLAMGTDLEEVDEWWNTIGNRDVRINVAEIPCNNNINGVKPSEYCLINNKRFEIDNTIDPVTGILYAELLFTILIFLNFHTPTDANWFTQLFTFSLSIIILYYILFFLYRPIRKLCFDRITGEVEVPRPWFLGWNGATIKIPIKDIKNREVPRFTYLITSSLSFNLAILYPNNLFFRPSFSLYSKEFQLLLSYMNTKKRLPEGKIFDKYRKTKTGLK